MIALTTVLRRNPGVRFRVLDDEAVVLHQGSAEVLVLDPVATRILSLADGVAPVSRWAEVLLREYDVPEEVLVRDVLDFAEELVREGLLENVAPLEAGP
jgi:coenzyme PQQ synthesis protein D (PqqD)